MIEVNPNVHIMQLLINATLLSDCYQIGHLECSVKINRGAYRKLDHLTSSCCRGGVHHL